MRRRDALQSIAGFGVALHLHPTPTDGGTDGGTRRTPEEAGPLDTLALDGAKEAVVTPDGETAFVATTDGFAAVDATDPESLSLRATVDDILADRENGPLGGIWDIDYAGERLLVVGPANATRNAFEAAVVYDVADPASPERTGVYETTYPIHNCALDGTDGYLTANDGDGTRLVVVDVTDPEELATWSLTDHDDTWAAVDNSLRTVHDVTVHDGTAALAHWDAGTWLLDVSDPAAPSFLAHIGERSPEEMQDLSNSEVYRQSVERPGNHHTTAFSPDGTVLAVGVESWNATGDDDGNADALPGGITLYDVSTLTDPAELATIDAPPTDDPDRDGVWTTAHNVELTDDYLYTSWYRGGVKVFDVSDPAFPLERYAWRDASAASFWTAQQGVAGEFFLASSRRDPSDEDAPGAVYAFPDVDATGATATTAVAGGRSTTATDAGPTAGAGPGFGVAAAVGGLALAGWRWLRE